MYFLIISLGLLLAMRGAKPAPIHRPGDGFRRAGKEALDFFLTTSLVLGVGALAETFGKTQAGAREYSLLIAGLMAYLLSRHQKKTDVFFLSVLVSVFLISSRQFGFMKGIYLAGGVSAGILLFQICFLGLRYKLLFSRIPASVKGWPVLCLLAGFISMILWGLRGLAF